MCCADNNTQGQLYVPFLGAFSKFRKATVIFVMSVRLHGITVPTGRVFMKLGI